MRKLIVSILITLLAFVDKRFKGNPFQVTPVSNAENISAALGISEKRSMVFAKTATKCFAAGMSEAASAVICPGERQPQTWSTVFAELTKDCNNVNEAVFAVFSYHNTLNKVLGRKKTPSSIEDIKKSFE